VRFAKIALAEEIGRKLGLKNMKLETICFDSHYLPLETHERLLVTSQKFGKIYAENLENVYRLIEDLIVNRIICYKKLWKLLIDRGLNKVELQRLTGVSSATITKLAKNETVNTRVLAQICNVLECDVSDIMEMQDKAEANNGKGSMIRL